MFNSTNYKTSPTNITGCSTHDADHRNLRSDLVRAAAMRRTQLLNLRPIDANDHVATEYRASVRRIFGDIHAALDRMDAGTYGNCADCGTRVSTERLLDRPWVARCEPCTSRLL